MIPSVWRIFLRCHPFGESSYDAIRLANFVKLFTIDVLGGGFCGKTVKRRLLNSVRFPARVFCRRSA